jgi:signal transduction histidine kinase
MAGDEGGWGRGSERPADVSVARDRMERLLRLIVEIGSDLDIEVMSQRVVTATMELTGARYGALGVSGVDGRLVSFVQNGLDPATVARIGELPAGKGLLGVLLQGTDILRLDDLTEHPDSGGFPAEHPPMRAFLGVPISIRDAVFGSLYLADDRPGWTFDEHDEDAARALASAAGVAIDNARLFERAVTSARWMSASREITTALLSGVEAPLRLIAQRARELTDAEQAIVLVPAEPDIDGNVDDLIVVTAIGVHADEVMGAHAPVAGSTTGEVFTTGEPVITESFRYPIVGFTDVGQRPAIVMPLRSGGTTLGVIAVARHHSQPGFPATYLDLVSDFAGHAAIALTLATARSQERENTVLADRERIALDLHDHVIQKLFAAGMELQGTIARARSPEVASRLRQTVDDLHDTVQDIRATIFALRPTQATNDFRERVHDIVSGLTDQSGILTTVRLTGPLSIVDSDLAEQAEAVISEAVSNCVRHSGAGSITVQIAVADEFVIDIADDGVGIAADVQRRSGLANLVERARRMGGSCGIGGTEGGGTRIHWTAPLMRA